MKIRYFGFLNPNCSVSLDNIRFLIPVASDFLADAPKTITKPVTPTACSHCGGKRLYRASIAAFRGLPDGAGQHHTDGDNYHNF